MKISHKLSIVILVLLVTCSATRSWAQPVAADTTAVSDSTLSSNGLQLLARYTGNSVLLRWAPGTPERWLHGNRYGYWLERAAIQQEGYFDPTTFMPLTAQPIQVGTQEDFKKYYAGGENEYVAVAAQAVFGKSSTPASDMTEQIADLKSRWGFAILAADFSQQAARSLGLCYEDKTVQSDQVYAYRIRFATPDTLPGLPDLDYFFVKTDVVAPALPPRLLPSSENEGCITLFWDRAWHQEHFSAYYIERSEDEGKTYKRLNRAPYTLPLSDSYTSFGRAEFAFKDSVSSNYKPFLYRLIGINAFGELSPPSFPVVAMARDRTPPSPPERVRAQYLGNRAMQITWDKNIVEPDFAGFHVVRSSNVDSRYQPLNDQLLPKDTRSYTDTGADEEGSNFYMVVAVDTAGNGSISLYSYGQVIDSLPPVAPKGLAGSIDTNGVVRLHWNLGSERDLKGYIVHYSNAVDHEMACITPEVLLDTLFLDTIPLNTLTQKIYYRVVAVDMHGNHSPFSPLLELTKPDTIPPTAPLFSDYLISGSRIDIKWVASSSEDVKKHYLLRREPGENAWKTIYTTTSVDTYMRFTDSLTAPGRAYEYWVRAEDAAGLRSRPMAYLSVKMPDLRLKPAVQNVVAQVNNNKNVVIRWKYPFSEQYKMVIYKADQGSNFTSCSSFPSGNRTAEYIDADVKVGHEYEYTLKVFYADGKESGFSPICKIKVQ